ncbi:MAG: GNAT family N-acetyltransferase [Chitinophagaceae bacterium]|nr:GNAT family N-acetyltransferase [Chitinophagaceae bacterium]
MLQLNFTPFPILSTERLVLRAVEQTDANEIFFLRSDQRVLQYLDKAPATSDEEAKDFINLIQQDQLNNNSILWGITLKNKPLIIGTIGYWRMQKEHYRAEIGYVLHPDLQGKGVMNEAMQAVLKYGFETMNLHSVEANVNPANIASVKLLKKNNFIKEAYFKENYYYNGKFFDSLIYSLLAPKK